VLSRGASHRSHWRSGHPGHRAKAGLLSDFEADIAVIGAGPAGSAAAIALAAFCRVVMLERGGATEDRIGETMPQAARPLLEELGLWSRFSQEQQARCRARRCRWGGAEPVDEEDPRSLGWRLDRRAFEVQLRAAVTAAGVDLLAPVGVTCVNRDPKGWGLEFVGRGYERPMKLRARLVIDAGGRGSRTLRPFGQTRLAEDRLVCAWIHAPLIGDPSDHLYVESDPEGWWYSAALPDGRRLIAFHTDSDLPVTGQLLQSGLVERARLSPGLSGAIADCDLGRVAPVRFCAAHGARLDTAVGEGWVAAGDAALCFDPLASHGLHNALHFGIQAAATARRMLDGDDEAGADYDAEITRLWRVARQQRDARYAEEGRWAENPFWRRRLA
jgi:flavin-dependent dehydrogenase